MSEERRRHGVQVARRKRSRFKVVQALLSENLAREASLRYDNKVQKATSESALVAAQNQIEIELVRIDRKSNRTSKGGNSKRLKEKICITSIARVCKTQNRDIPKPKPKTRSRYYTTSSLI